jgi:hypothetical protein
MGESTPRTIYLPLTALATQLMDCFEQGENAEHPGMRERKAPTARVQRQIASRGSASLPEQTAARSFLAKAEILEDHEWGDREGVVDLDDIHIFRPKTRLDECVVTASACSGSREIGHA